MLKTIHPPTAPSTVRRGSDQTNGSWSISRSGAGAGISLGTLYHYFPGKKQIFLAVLTQDEQNTQALLEELTDDPDPSKALLRFVSHVAEPATAHPIVPKLVLEAMLQAHRDQEVLAALENAESSETEGIKTLLGRATEAGTVDPELDVDEAAEWINALVGALYLEAATNSAFDPAKHQPHLIRTVRAFLQRPEA